VIASESDVRVAPGSRLVSVARSIRDMHKNLHWMHVVAWIHPWLAGVECWNQTGKNGVPTADCSEFEVSGRGVWLCSGGFEVGRELKKIKITFFKSSGITNNIPVLHPHPVSSQGHARRGNCGRCTRFSFPHLQRRKSKYINDLETHLKNSTKKGVGIGKVDAGHGMNGDYVEVWT
jgi:hypothetical protein